MALSDSVTMSLKEAESHLRNALAYAARQERPVTCSSIADVLARVESLQSFDGILDKIDSMIDRDR